MESIRVLELLTRSMREVLPDLPPGPLETGRTLEEYGANSIDRAEILTYVMRDLEIEIPSAQMHKGNRVADLIRLFERSIGDPQSSTAAGSLR